MGRPKPDMIKGTLDMLILKTLAQGPMHGYGVARWIEERTGEALQVEEGSLYPALYRMARRGWIRSEWGTTEHNRRAKFYALTAKGKKRLDVGVADWRRFTVAVGRVLEEKPA